MPQPVPYTRSYDFTSYQEDFPNQPLPAAPLDANLDAIGISVNGVVSRINLIQRDDGALANLIVTPESLSQATKNLMGNFNPRGAWVTATAYAVRDVISTTDGTYVCAIAHTSGVFATDYTAGKWLLIATTGSAVASFFQPTGSSAPSNGMYLPASNTVGFSANSLDVLRLASVASAQNYFQMTNSASSNAVVLAALGVGSNLDITLTPKGTGVVRAPELVLTTNPLAIASGGTGAVNAATARTNLGATTVGNLLFIAVNALDALDTLGFSAFMQTLRDDADAATARTTLDAEQLANSLGAAPPALSDYLAGVDVSASNASKKFLLSDILALTSSVGGFKNKIINGDFRYWDYGTTYALTTSIAYGSANRWASVMGSSAAGIFNRDTNPPVGGYYNAKVGRNNGSSLTNNIAIYQALESVNSMPLAGQTVTLSFYAKKGANFSAASNILGTIFNTGTGLDQSVSSMNANTWSGQVQTYTPFTLTASWQRFQVSFAVPSNATQVGIQIYYTPTGTAGADDNFYLANVQLEIGSVATPFEDRGAAIEKILCQRYLPHFNFPAGETMVAFGQAQSTSQIRVGLPFPVETRVAPTGLVVSAAASFSISRAAGATVCNNVTFPAGTSTKKIGGVDFALGSTPLTNDQCYFAIANTAASLYFTGCEL